MKVYKYFAIKKTGEKVEGRVEAETEKEARSAIIELGLMPTRIVGQDGVNDSPAAKAKARAEERKAVRLKKLSAREKIDFTATLQTLLRSGVPLIEALVFLESDTNSKRMKVISAELRRQIIGGSSFADVVEKYPQTFDSLYSGLVRAGEESGELDVTLERMSGLLKKQDNLKSKIIGVLAYPAIILVFAAIIVIVMLTFVFPRFAEMYEGMGAELPWITQTCIDVGTFMAHFWIIPLTLPFVIWFSIVKLFEWPPFKRAFDEFLLSVPLVKEFDKLAEFSNFVSVMLVSYEAGVPIVDCLYLANYTVGNVILREAIEKSRIKVQQGLHLSTALKLSEVMPPILLFMVSTGEQSGKLGEMLAKASDYIDNQLDRVIDIMTKFIEPIMLVIIGAIVLVLALALYLPLFQSYANIGN